MRTDDRLFKQEPKKQTLDAVDVALISIVVTSSVGIVTMILYTISFLASHAP